ncbi:MAG: lipopolysaccharide assembly protein LapA domain-containing protein [Bauldia sp.]
MRRFVSLFVLLPLAVVIVFISVANRHAATFSLDPFGSAAPALSVTAPLFVLLFVTLLIGIVVGGIAVWFGQGKWRRAARAERANAARLRRDVESFRERLAAATPALPPPKERDAA